MATPDQPDEGHIADTGMFKRFVAHEEEMDQTAESTGSGRWIAIGAVVVIVIAAVIVWLALR